MNSTTSLQHHGTEPQGRFAALLRNATVGEPHTNTAQTITFVYKQADEDVDVAVSADASTRQVSDVADALSFILKAAGMAENTHAGLLAAIGFAAGRTVWIKAPDKLVGRRLPNTGDDVSDENAARRWRYAWQKIEAEQERIGLCLVERQAGGRNREGQDESSRLRVPVVQFVADVVAAAKQQPSFRQKRGDCLENAAKQIVADIRGDYRRAPDKYRRPRTDDESRLTALTNRASTDISKALDILTANGGDIDEYFETLKRLAIRKHQEAAAPVTPNVSSLPIESIRESQAGGGAEEGTTFRHRCDDGKAMLQAFAAAGAYSFDVTLRDTKQKVEFMADVPFAWLSEQLPRMLEKADRLESSLIVRPRVGDGCALVQLDDLNAETVARLSDFAVCALETSPNNYQAFVAVSGVADEKERESVRARLIAAAAADKGATGAARLAGSFNAKEKYRQADNSFVCVRLVSVSPGRTVTVAELDAAFLLAAIPPQPTPSVSDSDEKRGVVARVPRREPSYEKAMASVRRKADGSVDRSAVDALFAVTCLNWNWTPAETVNILRRNSPKAAEKSRDNYAERTVAWAESQARKDSYASTH